VQAQLEAPALSQEQPMQAEEVRQVEQASPDVALSPRSQALLALEQATQQMSVEAAAAQSLAAQEAQRKQMELNAEEVRQQQIELEAQQMQQQEELKEQQLQFQQRLQQKMDPAVAARIAKQREKQELEDVNLPTTPTKKLDPVLQKRWNAMEERQAAGEDRAKSIEDKVAESKRQDKPESELAKRMAKRSEKAADSAEVGSPRSQALEAKLRTQSKESELAKRMAKQQEQIKERLEKGGDGFEQGPKQVAEAMSELAKKLQRQQELNKNAEELQEHSAANGKEHEAASSSSIEQKRLSLPRGQSVVHTFDWSGKSDSFVWNAIVLEHDKYDLTVDLEITAVLKPEHEGGPAQTIILQKNARGGTHVGSFTPNRDKRTAVVREAAGDGEVSPGNRTHREVEAIVFNFSNVFSWFTAKEVEFMSLFE